MERSSEKKKLYCPPYEKHDRVYDGREWDDHNIYEWLFFSCRRCGKKIKARLSEDTTQDWFVDEWGHY